MRCKIAGREVDLAIEERLQRSTDARRTTASSGSSGEAAIQQTKTRRGESGAVDKVRAEGRSVNEQALAPYGALAAPSPILLFGQVPGGKNAIGITRSGRHYPNKRFAEWRADAALQIAGVGYVPKHPIDYPVHLSVKYWAGDRRTRDVTGMGDALFHLLVYVKILKNDGLVRDLTWRWCGVNKQCPKVELTLLPME